MRAAPVVAVCIAALTAGVLIAAANLNGSDQAPNAFVGNRWVLVAVDHAGKHIVVPATPAATIEFSAAGTVVANDSVNMLSGRYESTPSGFVTHDVASTLVGYAGSDEQRLTIIAAVDAMFLTTAGSPVAATARVTGNNLVVDVDGYELTFR
jgi:hypothetical protein